MQIGCVIANIIMIMNCDIVVFGGEYRVFKNVLIPEIQSIIDRFCIIPAPVVASELGERGTSAGMVTLCREMYFDDICGVIKKNN